MGHKTRSADQWLAGARAAFQNAGITDPAGDARRLVAAALDMSLTELVTKGSNRFPDEAEEERLSGWIERRLAREPVHRIIGVRQFYGLDLSLSPDTLEPRPDTEILVDAVLGRAGKLLPVDRPLRVLDLGTGTGAIALALIANCPRASVVAADISSGALEAARRNAQLLRLEARFVAIQSNWYERVAGRFDIIVSNPPYIRSSTIPTLDPEVRKFDPSAALDGGIDGLDAYRAIAAGAWDVLSHGGFIAVEIGWDQQADVSAIFIGQGFILLESAKDYGGNDRVLLFSGPKG